MEVIANANGAINGRSLKKDHRTAEFIFYSRRNAEYREV